MSTVVACACCRRTFHDSLVVSIDYRQGSETVVRPVCFKCAGLEKGKKRGTARGKA